MFFFKKIGEKDRRKNKVVFVNRFYWPDVSATSQLLTDLAEHLASNGTDVTVITSRLHYASPETKLPPAEQHNGVNICRVRTSAFHRSSLLGRLLDFVTFCVSSTIALIKLVKPNDIVVAKTDPPLIQLFAWIAVGLRRARLVNWCQDLFPEVAFAVMRDDKPSKLSGALSQLRNFALKRSDVTVTVSDEMRQTLISQGVNRDRVIVIKNWCGKDVVPVPKEKNALREEWGLNDDFVIGYSGNLGRAHVPEKIYELVKELANVPKVKLLFIGSGHGMSWLKQRCHDERRDHVIFKPYQPRAELSTSLSLPDLHLMSLKSGCQKYLAPSKFYGILAAGRPVAFLGDRQTDLAKEIDHSGIGITLPIDRPSSWRSVLLSMIGDRAGLIEMGVNARKVYEQRFTPGTSLNAWQSAIETDPVFAPVPAIDKPISTTQ